MVNRPVGPPGEPPVPTVGAMLRGSPSDRSVCAAAAAHSVNSMSASQSALLASLIAFLLRNEYGTFAGRDDHAEWVAGSARRNRCWLFIASEHPPKRDPDSRPRRKPLRDYKRPTQSQIRTASAHDRTTTCSWSGAARGAEPCK